MVWSRPALTVVGQTSQCLPPGGAGFSVVSETPPPGGGGVGRRASVLRCVVRRRPGVQPTSSAPCRPRRLPLDAVLRSALLWVRLLQPRHVLSVRVVGRYEGCRLRSPLSNTSHDPHEPGTAECSVLSPNETPFLSGVCGKFRGRDTPRGRGTSGTGSACET